MTHNKYISFAFAALLAVAFVSCSSDPTEPGRTFMPGMTYSPAYETYSKSTYFDGNDSMTAFLPVEGTIARGMLPATGDEGHYSYMYKSYYANTDSIYNLSGSILTNPLEPTKEVLAVGKRAYNINCAICHGEKGNGDGVIIKNEAYPGVPPNFDTKLQEIKEGTVFHVMTYGKGLMGSYSSQLNVEERWAVVYYIQKMAKAGVFAADAAPADDNTEEETTSEAVEEVSDSTTTEG